MSSIVQTATVKETVVRKHVAVVETALKVIRSAHTTIATSPDMLNEIRSVNTAMQEIRQSNEHVRKIVQSLQVTMHGLRDNDDVDVETLGEVQDICSNMSLHMDKVDTYMLEANQLVTEIIRIANPGTSSQLPTVSVH